MVLQAGLEGAGFGLPRYGVDGIFGPETEGAVRAGQQQFGLAVTGIAERRLFERLGITGQISGDSTGSGNSPAGTARWILAGITIGAIAYGLKTSQEAGHG